MKKIIESKKSIKLLFGLLVMLFTGCEGFLEDAAQPLDQPGGENFYNSVAKVRGGTLGVYERLYSIYEHQSNGGLMSVYENRSDNAQESPGGTDHFNNFSTIASQSPTSQWNENFAMIARANGMIAGIPDGIPDWEQNPLLRRYMGEVRFLRAFAYMHLTAIFGNVPMFTEPLTDADEALTITKNSVSEIYDVIIIPDLEYAQEHCFTKTQLDDLNDTGMASMGAAKILLAEAYMTMESPNYPRAEELAEDVIASGEYSLMPTYASLYGDGADNNEESVWEIQYDFNANSNATAYTRLLPFVHQSLFSLTTSTSVPSMDLLDIMLATDDTLRYAVSVDSGLYSDLGDPNRFVVGQYWNKWVDKSLFGTANIEDDWNIRIFRLADAYHMAAEAEIQQGKIDEAFAHLNPMRSRANMPDYDHSGVSQDEALDMYLHERRIEFAGEMKRWRDLKRTGKTIEILQPYLSNYFGISTPIETTQLVYPIPVGEIQANPLLSQNPGY